MLTEQERKWLEKRRTKDAPCGACWRWCRTECKEACDRLTSDYRDAAEFEARAKLIILKSEDNCIDGGIAHCDDCNISCHECMEANAYLLAEQEIMDNDGAEMA